MKKDDRIGRFERFKRLRYQPTDRPTNRPTDQPTDMTSYRSARTHLKTRYNIDRFGVQSGVTQEAASLSRGADNRGEEEEDRADGNEYDEEEEATPTGGNDVQTVAFGGSFAADRYGGDDDDVDEQVGRGHVDGVVDDSISAVGTANFSSISGAAINAANDVAAAVHNHDPASTCAPGDCPVFDVTTPLLLFRSAMKLHVEVVCPQRLVDCPDCGQKDVIARFLQLHRLRECRKVFFFLQKLNKSTAPLL